MYPIAVDIAAPLAPYFGTRITTQIKFTNVDNAEMARCHCVFLTKLIPETVISESEYITGINIKKGTTFMASE
ncbi:hypothetical protein GCM10022392_14150 [Mucilaginibacter panaciglaebae]|uniref:Uncharacterized protein n=1 Tax=Mucilaginibacter panaciglaebae TaxID=502331 RepID=A0ABP7WND4_9SPHI